MTDGTLINQREIIFLPFPFTDLKNSKPRPVLILSTNKHNSKNEDVICCALTSNPNKFNLGIEINNKDLENGHLDYNSAIVPCKVFCPNKKLNIKILGKLNKEKSKEIVSFLNLRIKVEE
jgi:mRNA interferase MazF